MPSGLPPLLPKYYEAYAARRYGGLPRIHDPIADEDVRIKLESFGNICTPETGFVWMPACFQSISREDHEHNERFESCTYYAEGCEPRPRLEPYVRGDDDCLLDAVVRSADRYEGGMDFLRLVLSLQGKKMEYQEESHRWVILPDPDYPAAANKAIKWAGVPVDRQIEIDLTAE